MILLHKAAGSGRSGCGPGGVNLAQDASIQHASSAQISRFGKCIGKFPRRLIIGPGAGSGSAAQTLARLLALLHQTAVLLQHCRQLLHQLRVMPRPLGQTAICAPTPIPRRRPRQRSQQHRSKPSHGRTCRTCCCAGCHTGPQLAPQLAYRGCKTSKMRRA